MSSAVAWLSSAELAALGSMGHPFELLRYLDVRSVEEFGAGHVPGSYNIPWQHGTLAGLVENDEFLPVVTRLFERSTRLVLGCQRGNRAFAAAQCLALEGYMALFVHRDSFEGQRDAFGRLSPGWSQLGYPTEQGQPEARCYATLRDSPRLPLE